MVVTRCRSVMRRVSLGAVMARLVSERWVVAGGKLGGVRCKAVLAAAPQEVQDEGVDGRDHRVESAPDALVKECMELHAEMGVRLPTVEGLDKDKADIVYLRYSRGMHKAKAVLLTKMGGTWKDGKGVGLVSQGEMDLALAVAEAGGVGTVPHHLTMHRGALTAWIKEQGFKVGASLSNASGDVSAGPSTAAMHSYPETPAHVREALQESPMREWPQTSSSQPSLPHPSHQPSYRPSYQPSYPPSTSSSGNPPSAKQVAFTQSIIDKLGVVAPQGWENDRNVCNEFLDEHIHLTPPSDNQLGAVRAIMQQGIATPPEGWETDRQACSAFLDQHIATLREGRGEVGERAATRPSEKQVAFASKIIRTLGIASPPPGWDTDLAVCKKFLDDHANRMPPSPKQIKLAETIADNRDMRVPPEVRASAKACSAFIDEHMQRRGPPGGGQINWAPGGGYGRQ